MQPDIRWVLCKYVKYFFYRNLINSSPKLHDTIFSRIFALWIREFVHLHIEPPLNLLKFRWNCICSKLNTEANVRFWFICLKTHCWVSFDEICVTLDERALTHLTSLRAAVKRKGVEHVVPPFQMSKRQCRKFDAQRAILVILHHYTVKGGKQ